MCSGRREERDDGCKTVSQRARETPVHHPPVEENLPSQALTMSGNLASRHRRSHMGKGHSPGE